MKNETYFVIIIYAISAILGYSLITKKRNASAERNSVINTSKFTNTNINTPDIFYIEVSVDDLYPLLKKIENKKYKIENRKYEYK